MSNPPKPNFFNQFSNHHNFFPLTSVMLVHVSSKKMCLLSHSTYHLKAHRIGNSMVLKLPAQRQEKGYGD